MKLNLEKNHRNPLDLNFTMPSGAALLLTASTPQDRCLFRVRLLNEAALLAVPEFGGINICLDDGGKHILSFPYETDPALIADSFCKKSPAKQRLNMQRAVIFLQQSIKQWRCGLAK